MATRRAKKTKNLFILRVGFIRRECIVGRAEIRRTGVGTCCTCGVHVQSLVDTAVVNKTDCIYAVGPSFSQITLFAWVRDSNSRSHLVL